MPLIGLGQITVTEVQKKQNNIDFINNLTYYFKSGLGIELFPSTGGPIQQSTLLSYHLIPNVNYKISINNKLGIYNNISIPIILRTRSKVEFIDYPDPFDPNISVTQEWYYSSTIISKLDYCLGIESKISHGIQGRLGIIIPIYTIAYSTMFNETEFKSPKQWGGGVNFELDYSLNDNLFASLSISSEFSSNPFKIPTYARNQQVIEILTGINYKL